MPTGQEIYHLLELIAPIGLAFDYDNVGFLVGDRTREVSQVLVALDITPAVVEEAEKRGAELIVSHHPVIFHKLQTLTEDEPRGRLLAQMIRGGISAICMHTNLDAAMGGVNDCLAEALGLTDYEALEPDTCIGRVGQVPSCALAAFLNVVTKALGTQGLRYVDAYRPVRRVAVGSGASGDLLGLAAMRDCDTFVTADVKHSTFIEAKARGINLIDAGHFSTENVVVPKLIELLRDAYPYITVEEAAANIAPEQYYID